MRASCRHCLKCNFKHSQFQAMASAWLLRNRAYHSSRARVSCSASHAECRLFSNVTIYFFNSLAPRFSIRRLLAKASSNPIIRTLDFSLGSSIWGSIKHASHGCWLRLLIAATPTACAAAAAASRLSAIVFLVMDLASIRCCAASEITYSLAINFAMLSPLPNSGLTLCKIFAHFDFRNLFRRVFGRWRPRDFSILYNIRSLNLWRIYS